MAELAISEVDVTYCQFGITLCSRRSSLTGKGRVTG